MERVVKITYKELKRVENFVKARCGGSVDLYKRRGGFKPEDILVGALAEVGVYKLLKEYGFDVTPPDFSIHNVEKKSFNADLIAGQRHFHIKGQSLSSARKYGSSWLMQRTDPLFNLEQRGHYLVPTNVDIDAMEVIIHGFFNFSTVLHYEGVCISECAVPSFRKTKRAIYLENLDIITEKGRWGVLFTRKG